MTDEAVRVRQLLEKLSGQAPDETDLLVRFDLELQRNALYDASAALFAAVCEAAPIKLEALSALAQNAFAERNFALATDRWHVVIQRDNTNVTARLRLARSLLALKEIDAAEMQLEALQKLTKNVWSHHLAVDILIARGQREKALETIDSAIETYTDNLSLILRHGTILYQLGRWKEAETYLQEKLLTKPGDISILKSLARIATGARRFELAEARWHAIIEMEPSDLIAQLNYVRCLIENFDADVAQRHLDSIAGQFESSKLWNCQIWILTAYRNVRRTLEYIEGLLRKNPLGSASPYVLEDLMLQKLALLVRLNQEDEKHVESRQIDDTFAQLLGIRPMNISIRKQLCDVLIAADRNEEAAIQVDLLPDIPDDQITSLRIWRLHSFGDVAGAKATWEFRRKSMHVPMIQPCDPNTLERVDQLESVERDGEVTLFTAIRNERARLPWFLEYYRRIGVDRFVFVDNRSEDESRTYLQQQPDVHLYIAHETYAQRLFWCQVDKRPDATPRKVRLGFIRGC